VAEATSTLTGKWTCVDDVLTYEVETPDATAPGQVKEEWKVKKVQPRPGTQVGLSAYEDDDTWCESTGICNRLVSDYIGVVKGNAFFGMGGETWGSFDVGWRQNFNGRMPRWKLTLDWDSGSGIDSDGWIAYVREENGGWFDGNWCSAEFAGGDVNQFYEFYQSGLNPCSRVISKAETWHDDLKGWFYSRGERFAATVLHTGHWKSDAEGYNLRYTSKWY